MEFTHIFILLAVRREVLLVVSEARHDVPFAFAGLAAFVADPAHIRRAARHDDVRLQFDRRFPNALKVIFLLGLSGSVRTAGAVKPKHEDLAVVRQKLGELLDIKIVVAWGAVQRAVAVPRGKVDAEFQPVFAAGIRHFAHHIALAVIIRAVFDGMFGRLCGPKAEAVVVLAGEDHAFHAGIRDRLAPLVSVLRGGIKNAFGFLAVAPFAVRKGIDRVVDKGVIPHFLDQELTAVGDDARVQIDTFLLSHNNLRVLDFR